MDFKLLENYSYSYMDLNWIRPQQSKELEDSKDDGSFSSVNGLTEIPKSTNVINIPESRLPNFVIGFVRALESTLYIHHRILEEELYDAKKILHSYQENVENPAESLVANFILIKSNEENNFNGRKVNFLIELIKRFNKNKFEFREAAAKASFDIFQSYQMQFVGINDWEKWMNNLAEKAVDKTIDFCLRTADTNVPETEELISKGIINGTSNEKLFSSPKVRSKFNQIERRWSVGSIYEKPGVFVEEDGAYYKRPDSEPKSYGYRRSLPWEKEEIKKETNKYTRSLKIDENFKKYEYVNLNKDDTITQILNKIARSSEFLSDERLQKIVETAQKEIKNQLKSLKWSIKNKNECEQDFKLLKAMNHGLQELKVEDYVNKYYRVYFHEMEMETRKYNKTSLRKDHSEKDRDLWRPLWFKVQNPVYLFTGRDQELEDLHALIQRNTESNITFTVISGCGGIGKTQLARRYIEKHAEDYENVIWISNENEADLSRNFTLLAKNKLNIKTVMRNMKSILEDVYKTLQNRKTLLIFDNAKNDDTFLSFLPQDHGSNNKKKLYVVITSRCENWKLDTEVMALNEITTKDGMKLVKKGLDIKNENESENDNIKNLLEKLQNFPLVIAQAIAYIQQRKTSTENFSIKDYLGEFAEVDKDFQTKLKFRNSEGNPISKLETSFYRDPHAEIISKAWEIVTNTVVKDPKYGDLALNILKMISYLAPYKIKTEMFLEYAENKEHKLLGAIRLLKRYSIINGNQKLTIINIHKLVQKVTRLKVKLLNEELKVIKLAMGILQKSLPINNYTVTSDDKLRQMLPHLEAFWKHVKNGIENNTMDSDYLLIFSKLTDWQTFGYEHFGNVEKVKNVIEVYLNFQKQPLASDTKKREKLATAYQKLDAIHKKKSLLEVQFNFLKEQSDLDTEQIASILRRLGNIYGDLGEIEKQRELLGKALSIIEKHYGPDHYHVVTILESLGKAYGDLSDVQKQKELLEKALNILEKNYGPNHFFSSNILESLGKVYRDLGDVQKQKECLEKAYNILENHYGPDHYNVAAILESLGKAYGNLGDVQKQKELLEKALNILEKHYGPNHYQVAAILESLGKVYGDLGEAQKQKELLDEALIIQEEKYGLEPYEIGQMISKLTNEHRKLGEFEKEKELVERASTLKRTQELSHYNEPLTWTKPASNYGDTNEVEKQNWLFIIFNWLNLAQKAITTKAVETILKMRLDTPGRNENF